MPINSNRKGDSGEREAARELNAVLGTSARRGQQRSGLDEQDVIDHLPGTHCEVKRVECLRLYDAVDQAVRDAGDNTPFVMHRRNRRPWLVVVRLEDLPRFAAVVNEQTRKQHEGSNEEPS